MALAHGWTLACDDRDAVAVARSEGVPVVTTVAILKGCVRNAAITPEEAADLLDDLINLHGRRLPRLGPDEL